MAERNFSVGNTLVKLLDDKKYFSLRDVLTTMNPADIAAVFDELDESRLPLMFRLLPKELAAETFVEMQPDPQEAADPRLLRFRAEGGHRRAVR